MWYLVLLAGSSQSCVISTFIGMYLIWSDWEPCIGKTKYAPFLYNEIEIQDQTDACMW